MHLLPYKSREQRQGDMLFFPRQGHGAPGPSKVRNPTKQFVCEVQGKGKFSKSFYFKHSQTLPS